MISKNEIKYIQSLFQKKNRDKEELFIAEGVKLVDEILGSDFAIKKIYATDDWIKGRFDVSKATIITQHELEKITGLNTPNQVLALVEKNKLLHEPIQKNNIILALDGIQDPGNLGTIIRIADWFGITQVIAGIDTADVYNPKIIQSTMGSITRVNIWYKDLTQWLLQSTTLVYGALLDGKNVYETERLKEGIIVIGNESKGIRNNVLPFIQHPITIPAKGKAESLNAAIATGIILSHLVR